MQNPGISQLHTSHWGLLQLPRAANMCQQSKHQWLFQHIPKWKAEKKRIWTCHKPFTFSFFPPTVFVGSGGMFNSHIHALHILPWKAAIADMPFVPHMVEKGTNVNAKVYASSHLIQPSIIFLQKINIPQRNGSTRAWGIIPLKDKLFHHRNDTQNTNATSTFKSQPTK